MSIARHKNNGDPNSQENYKPITILSCFGNLFTSILNFRWNDFLDAYNFLEENQAGFRAGYSPMDHMFVLYVLTETVKAQKKRHLFTSVKLRFCLAS